VFLDIFAFVDIFASHSVFGFHEWELLAQHLLGEFYLNQLLHPNANFNAEQEQSTCIYAKPNKQRKETKGHYTNEMVTARAIVLGCK